ncbi:MAG: DNA repair protein RecO [Parcubacteria group bacterium]|nr:DNA repair protein RecO [Parcubacteria group bacterium]
MPETYNLKVIILNRWPFAEDHGRVAVYSLERGRLELVVRGLKKIKSKLAGHLEPITLANIMAVRGRQYDYAGAAVSEQGYFNIKNDLEKIAAAGQAFRVFNKIIKADQADQEIFELLKNFLAVLNRTAAGKVSPELLAWLFIFKLLVKLGHKPELYYCVNCRAKILPAGLKFDLARGGLIGAECSVKLEPFALTISENSVKLLRLVEKNDFNKLSKIKINNKEENQVKNIINSFLGYYA